MHIKLPRACWFKIDKDWFGGTLHAWGQDYEEFVSGPGMFPVGVIEDEAGKVHSIHVDSITFGAIP